MENLFKAKTKDNGEWVEGYYLFDNRPNGGHYIIFYKGYSELVYEIDESTLCRYTGLTDKNVNKIWENDILCSNSKEKYIVRWRFGGFELLHRACATPIYAYAGTDLYINENTLNMKVFGNTFDNPELSKM